MIVATADSGEKGWSMALQSPPDLVVLDLTLPGLDGFSLLRRLRQNETTTDVPIFIYTAKELNAYERSQLNQAELVLQKSDSSGQQLLEALTHLNTPSEKLR